MESRVSHYRGLMGNEISLFVHCCPFWALSFLKQRKRVHKKRSKGTTGDRKYKKVQKGTSRDKKGHIFSYWNCVISYNLHFNFYIKHMYNVYINIYISYIYISYYGGFNKWDARKETSSWSYLTEKNWNHIIVICYFGWFRHKTFLYLICIYL